MEKGRIADSSEGTATSDKAHRSVVLRPTRAVKAAAAMFPTSMPRAVTDMKAALRPALEAPECSQRPKSTPAMDKSKKSQNNANRTKRDRKSTRLTPVTNAHLVCSLLIEKKTKTTTIILQYITSIRQ